MSSDSDTPGTLNVECLCRSAVAGRWGWDWCVAGRAIHAQSESVNCLDKFRRGLCRRQAGNCRPPKRWVSRGRSVCLFQAPGRRLWNSNSNLVTYFVTKRPRRSKYSVSVHTVTLEGQKTKGSEQATTRDIDQRAEGGGNTHKPICGGLFEQIVFCMRQPVVNMNIPASIHPRTPRFPLRSRQPITAQPRQALKHLSEPGQLPIGMRIISKPTFQPLPRRGLFSHSRANCTLSGLPQRPLTTAPPSGSRAN